MSSSIFIHSEVFLRVSLMVFEHIIQAGPFLTHPQCWFQFLTCDSIWVWLESISYFIKARQRSDVRYILQIFYEFLKAIWWGIMTILQPWKKYNHKSHLQCNFFSLRFNRSVRRSTAPFGGIQLIICGDFLQLPPISKGKEKASFCFQVRP